MYTIIFLFCFIIVFVAQAVQTPVHASQSVVLTYEASQKMDEKIAAIFLDCLPHMPVVLCKIIAGYVPKGFVGTCYMKDPSPWVPDGYLSVTYIAPNIIAAGTSGQDIHVRDTDKHKITKKLKGHSHSVGTIAYEPQSRCIISGSYDGRVRLWDRTQEQPLFTLWSGKGSRYSKSPVTTMALLNQNTLVFGGPSHPITIGDLETQKPQISIKSTHNYDNLLRNTIHLARCTDHRFAAICDYGKTLKLADSREPATDSQGSSRGTFKSSISIDDIRLAVACNNMIEILDLRKPMIVCSGSNMLHDVPIVLLTKLTDKYLLSASPRDHTIKIWDIGKSSEKPPQTIAIPHDKGTDHIVALAANDEGTSITAAITGSPGSLYIWNLGIK